MLVCVNEFVLSLVEEVKDMYVRLLTEEDVAVYRDIRLEALQANPEAFGSTYEQEAQRDAEAWKARLSETRADRYVWGCFDESGDCVGVVTFVREQGRKERHKGDVYGMFVRANRRQRGVGQLLIRHLLTCVSEMEGVEQVRLTVVSNNLPAKRLYESVGFKVYGVEQNALKEDGMYWDEEWMVVRL